VGVEPGHASLHAYVEGRVQVVGFRAFVLETAQRLNLTGWVRNTRSREVEVWAEGPRAALDRLYIELQDGPSHALVTDVRAEWGACTGQFQRFNVRETI
jgi:acylphosphatase